MNLLQRATQRLESIIEETRLCTRNEYTHQMNAYAQQLIDGNSAPGDSEGSRWATVAHLLNNLNQAASEQGIARLSDKDAHVLLIDAVRRAHATHQQYVDDFLGRFTSDAARRVAEYFGQGEQEPMPLPLAEYRKTNPHTFDEEREAFRHHSERAKRGYRKEHLFRQDLDTQLYHFNIQKG